MSAIKKRSVPNRWDERRARRAARSAAYWLGEREAVSGDYVAQTAVAWDRLRAALRSLDRQADNRLARAKRAEAKREAERLRVQATRVIAETSVRATTYLDSLTEDIKGEW